jgi:hypothetical protein
MVVNHRKADAATTVVAEGDEDESKSVLVDIVSGEKIPFTVKDGRLSFDIAVKDRWGRALALLEKTPAKIEVAVGQPAIQAGERLAMTVRLLGGDEQAIDATLPVEITVTDPAGRVRDDLSGVRVLDRGVYAFTMQWPVAAKVGKWTVAVRDKMSGATDRAEWEAR